MSEYALQQVGKLVDQVDRIADAALRAARTEQARQDLSFFKQDLAILKRALRSDPVMQSKGGSGKGGHVLALVGVGAILVIVAAMVVLQMLQLNGQLNRSAFEESTADLWSVYAEWQTSAQLRAIQFALTLVALTQRMRAVLSEWEAGRQLPDCFEATYQAARAAIEVVNRFNNSPVLNSSAPRLARPTLDRANELCGVLKAAIEALIRCLDPSDSLGWWNRLVGPDGVITRVMSNLDRFLARPLRVTIRRPGQQ